MDTRYMTNDEKHLATRIRKFEDKLLRSKNMEDVMELRKIIRDLGVELQKMQYARVNGA